MEGPMIERESNRRELNPILMEKTNKEIKARIDAEIQWLATHN